MEKICDVSFVTLFDDVTINFLKFDFVMISLKNQSGQFTQLQVTKIDG